MLIQFNNPFLMLLISVALTSCGLDEEDVIAYELKAKSNARMIIQEIPLKYLSCYALEPEPKKKCISKLSKKYISPRLRNVPEYVEAFQFEAEKLGFSYFLNREGLKCESIINGPKFQEDKQAYKVRCMSNTKYYMRFDYAKGEWLLVGEDHQ